MPGVGRGEAGGSKPCARRWRAPPPPAPLSLRPAYTWSSRQAPRSGREDSARPSCPSSDCHPVSSFSVTSLCPLDRSQRRSSLSAGRGHSQAEQRSRVTGVSRACPPAFRRGREAVEHTPPRSAPARPWRRKGGGDAGVFVVSASAGDRGPREYPGLPHGGQGSCPRPWGLATTPPPLPGP